MIESFCKLVKGTSSFSSIEVAVNESQRDASLKKMRLVFSESLCVVLDDKYIKSLKKIKEFSCVYDNEKNCDGFVIVENESRSVFFVELKSRFSSYKIEEGLAQVINSYIKLLPFLLLSCDVKEFSLHFVIGCQCYEDDTQYEGIMEYIDSQFKMPRPNFGADILFPLLNHKGILKMSLKKLVDSCNNHAKNIGTNFFNNTIMESSVQISLVQTEKYGESEVSLMI